MLPAVTLQAQIVDWSNTTNDAPWYDVGANWIGGTAPTGTQTARFNQAATYNVLWDNTTTTNTPSVGFLDIQQGDVTFLDFNGNEQHLFTINGSGGNGSFSDFSVSGTTTKLTSRGLHLRSQGGWPNFEWCHVDAGWIASERVEIHCFWKHWVRCVR